MHSYSRNTVWIIDDNVVNQKILSRILQNSYRVRCAGSGKEALREMRQNLPEIAAIILDIHMAGFTGIDFLKYCRKNKNFHDIPILIASAEEQNRIEKECLELGATDFIQSPYDPSVIRHRLGNAVYRNWFRTNINDQLTGLYTREKFQKEMMRLLQDHPQTQFVLMSLDIDNFKTYNNFFGVEEGDHLLQFIGKLISEQMLDNQLALYARYSADFFLMLFPHDEKVIEDVVQTTVRKLKNFNKNYNIKPSFGVYIVDDPSLPLELMQDRVSLAAGKCKGKYKQYVGYYDKKLGERILYEQDVLNRIDQALKKEEFQVYYQPKYSLTTGRPTGAEALVRWINADGSIMMPGDFIPVLEDNGYISNLDYYVWEHVCASLHRWRAEKLPIMPVSVNVSLINLYNPNFEDILSDLLEKYELPAELLHLEFTESAFVENMDMVSDVLHRLHQKGFKVYLDDFGKGSASLNMLRSLPVDLLKIDMHLLPINPSRDRGGKILAALIRMAEWLQIPVVMEGTENPDQINFLRDNNCEYAQGFYFSRPVPEENYHKLLTDGCPSQELPQWSSDRQMMTEVWTSDTMVDKLFENIMEPLLVFELEGENLHIIRGNHTFVNKFGILDNDNDFDRILDERYITAQDRMAMIAEVKKAARSRQTTTCEFAVSDASQWLALHATRQGKIWLHAAFQFVERSGSRDIFTCVLSDITDSKRMLEELHLTRNAALYQEQFAMIALKMSGLCVWEYDPLNQCVYQLKGMPHLDGSDADVVENFPECMIQSGMIHREDIDPYRDMMHRLDAGEPEAEGIFRVRKKPEEEAYRYLHIKYNNIFNDEGKPFRAIGILLDQEEEQDDAITGTTARVRSGSTSHEPFMAPDIYLSAAYNLTTGRMERIRTSIEYLRELLGRTDREHAYRVITEYFGDNPENRQIFERYDRNYLLAHYDQPDQDRIEEEFLKSWAETGRRQWLSLEIYFEKDIQNGDIRAYYYVRDIDRRVREKQLLQDKAKSDEMTGLLNHGALIHAMQKYLEQEGSKGKQAAFMIDLDNFKQINDTYGHLTGDLAIRAVADHIRALFCHNDIIGRFGGDEFLVLMKNVERLEIIEQRVKALIRHLQVKNPDTGEEIPCACCVGVSVCTDGDKTYMQMLQEADHALYQAKGNGRSQYVIV